METHMYTQVNYEVNISTVYGTAKGHLRDGMSLPLCLNVLMNVL